VCCQASRSHAGSEHPFIGPDPACGISIGVAKKAVTDWTDRNHKKYWEPTTGLKQAKEFISRPSARRTKISPPGPVLYGTK
jgi:hypothetical protein